MRLALPSDAQGRILQWAHTVDVPNSLRVDSACLSWNSSSGSKEKTIDARALAEFAALADMSDEELLRFANRYGPLWLCREHRLPAAHNFQPLLAGYRRCKVETQKGEYREPTSSWRRFANQAVAAVRIIEAVRRDEPANLSVWDPIRKSKLKPAILSVGKTARLDTFGITWFIDNWLLAGGVHVQLGTTRVGPVPRLTGGLFGALGLQLAATLTGTTTGFVVCSACHRLYIPLRMPRLDERHYCGDPKCQRLKASRNQNRLRRRVTKKSSS